MANYAFFTPIQAGKIDIWKGYISEMTGPRKAALEASRGRVSLTKEVVWLQIRLWVTLRWCTGKRQTLVRSLMDS